MTTQIYGVIANEMGINSNGSSSIEFKLANRLYAKQRSVSFLRKLHLLSISSVPHFPELDIQKVSSGSQEKIIDIGSTGDSHTCVLNNQDYPLPDLSGRQRGERKC